MNQGRSGLDGDERAERGRAAPPREPGPGGSAAGADAGRGRNGACKTWISRDVNPGSVSSCVSLEKTGDPGNPQPWNGGLHLEGVRVVGGRPGERSAGGSPRERTAGGSCVWEGGSAAGRAVRPIFPGRGCQT